MLEQTYWGKFYWSVRRETSSECATRIGGLLDDLVAIDPSFCNWHIATDAGKRDALTPDQHQDLSEALRSGQNRNDVDDRPIDELGYAIRLSNEVTRIQAVCGCYSQWVPNNLILGPISNLKLPEVCRRSKMVQITDAIVQRLDPDHGVITSEEYDDVIYDYEDTRFTIQPGRPRSGWITYISNRYGSIPDLPPDAEVSPLQDRGNLITVTSDPFSASTVEHVDLANRLWQCLEGVSKPFEAE